MVVQRSFTHLHVSVIQCWCARDLAPLTALPDGLHVMLLAKDTNVAVRLTGGKVAAVIFSSSSVRTNVRGGLHRGPKETKWPARNRTHAELQGQAGVAVPDPAGTWNFGAGGRVALAHQRAFDQNAK